MSELLIMAKGPKPKPFQHFFTIDEGSGCWLWKSTITIHGYGLHNYKRKRMAAHRVSWILHNGEIPQGLFVLHKCDVRSCVNPAHLFLGTQSDNMQDCIKKGRFVKEKLLHTHCPSGHEFNEKNTRHWKNARVCKICDSQKTKRYLERKSSWLQHT